MQNDGSQGMQAGMVASNSRHRTRRVMPTWAGQDPHAVIDSRESRSRIASPGTKTGMGRTASAVVTARARPDRPLLLSLEMAVAAAALTIAVFVLITEIGARRCRSIPRLVSPAARRRLAGYAANSPAHLSRQPLLGPCLNLPLIDICLFPCTAAAV